MAKREVGTLWIGGELSWYEQLALKSFVDKGQDITLFCYGDVKGVPEGVKICDGRDIIDTDDFIKYKIKSSFALFADWFRLHMIHKRPGMIWVDTDVYCWQVMEYDQDEIYGFELHGKKRVNNAVLGLDAEGEMLRAMLDFTEDRFPIVPFLRQSKREELLQAKEEGNPIHVSELPWGVWGPLMLTYYVKKFKKLNTVQPVEAFYPVTFPERRKFLKAPRRALGDITENTTALHLWASLKTPLGFQHNGLAPDGSFLDMLCKETGINPTDAPILSRGKNKFKHLEEEGEEEKS